MANWKYLVLITVMVVLFVAPLALNPGAKYSGSDDQGGELIEQIQPSFKPWIQPWWQPPSSEIQSLLFCVQTGLGALIIGYYIGVFKAGSGVTKDDSKSKCQSKATCTSVQEE
jgi:cobalt/nickel transport protein